MISFFKRLYRKLFQWRHDYVPNTERFPQLDLDKIAADLHLATLGTERGAENKPDGAATTHDDIEQTIVAYFEAERNHAHDRTIRDLSVYDDRLASFAFLSKLDEVKKSANEATAQLHTLRLRGQGEIHESEQRVKEARRELLDFRKKHQLSRLAVYPESLIFRWGLVGFIIVVESVVNGFIFAASNSFGVLGGIVYALILSGLNVGIGLVAGRSFFPSLNHRSWFRRLVAMVSVLFYISVVLCLNLLAAHFRDISQSSAALNLEDILLPHILNNPFGLKQFSSWLLFALGVLFSFVAAADAYSMDDRYPGYGPVVRRAQDGVESFNEGYGTLLEYAENIRSSTADAMSSVINAANVEVANYRTLVEGRRRLIASYQDYVRYLEQCGNTVLQVYREANSRTRRTPNPPSFTKKWIAADGPLPELPGSLQLEAVDAHIRAAIDELQGLRRELLVDHAATIKFFAPLRDLIGQAAPNGEAT